MAVRTEPIGLTLVTGGAGIMGSRLSMALAHRGRPVRVLCLAGDAGAQALEAMGVEVVRGDVTRPESLAKALAGVHTVFHLAAILLSPLRPEAFNEVNAEGTRNLVRAAESAGVDHFIQVSSVSVLYTWSNAYARSKQLSEEIVRGSRLAHVTVVRPSLAYEDGGSAEFMRFVDHLRRSPWVFLPSGGRARKSPVHVEDLVAGFLAVPGNPLAYGKTYHFTGGEVLTLREMADALLRHMGRPKPIIGFPLWLGRILVVAAWIFSRLTGRAHVITWQSLTGLVQDAVPEDASAAVDLCYRPRPFREGLSTLHSLRGCLAR